MATPKAESETIGWRPHLIRSAIVDAVQILFSDADVLRDPILDNYVWSATESTTKIKIDVEGHVSLKNLGVQAHIAVVLGDTPFDDVLQNSDLYKRHADDGFQWRTFLARTKLIIRCFGEQEEFAIILASEVAIRLREAAKFLQEWNTWKRFRSRGIGAPKKVSDGEYSVDVPVEVHVGHSSKIHEDNLPSSLADYYDAY